MISRAAPAAFAMSLVSVAVSGSWHTAAAQADLPQPQAIACMAVDSLPAHLTGRTITSVLVDTKGPQAPGALGGLVNGLHRTSRASTITRHLLFAAGTPWDSVAIAESGRRLRTLPFLASARVMSRLCADSAVRVYVETVDTWSITPVGHYTEREETLGLHESNVLGTGRVAAIVMRWEPDASTGGYRFGAEGSADDPTLGDAASVSAAFASFRDGERWRAGGAKQEHSVADRWLLRGGVQNATQRGVRPADAQYARARGEILVGDRVTTVGAPRALYLLTGAAHERVALTAPESVIAIGPRAVRRGFDGALVGMALRSTLSDTVNWVLPQNGIIDLPRATEGELLIGIGRAGDNAAFSADGWVGGIARPADRLLIGANAWFLGSFGRRDVDTGLLRSGLQQATSRFAVTAVSGTAGRRTSFVVAGERLVRADPGTIAFTEYDITAPLLDAEYRRAASTLVARMERSMALRALSGSFALHGGLFAAFSERWGPITPLAADRTVFVAGAGIQLVPTRQGSPTVRLDLDLPVRSLHGGARAPRVVVAITPPFGATGRRLGSMLP